MVLPFHQVCSLYQVRPVVGILGNVRLSSKCFERQDGQISPLFLSPSSFPWTQLNAPQFA